MMRLLGIDYGERRIGLALSDPTGTFASALETICREDNASLFHHIVDVCREKEVGRIVVGLPRHMNGKDGTLATTVRHFAERLEKSTGCPVILWEERLSTVSAEKTLIEADMRRVRRRDVRDRVAAQFILQSYMDHQEETGGLTDL